MTRPGSEGRISVTAAQKSRRCCAPERGIASPSVRSCTRAPSPASAPVPVPVRIAFPGGRSHVGTDAPVIPADGEGPRRRVTLKPFEFEATTVTNARFAAFVAETGHVTTSQRFGWSHVFAGLLTAAPSETAGDTGLPWWKAIDGACWYQPEGPGSSIEMRWDHPVVHVSWFDAAAFAAWAGGRLPTEAEWEHAARAGASDPRFPWGDAEPTDEEPLCNIWQGDFPDENTCADGHYGTAPVGWGIPNPAGLYNTVGNVWEWTSDSWRVRSLRKSARANNSAARQRGFKTLKGGSFLCHREWCYRYRIAARSGLDPESATSNQGFRLCFDA